MRDDSAKGSYDRAYDSMARYFSPIFGDQHRANVAARVRKPRPGIARLLLWMLRQVRLGSRDALGRRLESAFDDHRLLRNYLPRGRHQPRCNLHRGGFYRGIRRDPYCERLHGGSQVVERFLELGRRLEGNRICCAIRRLGRR